MKTSSIAVETSRSTIQSDSIVRQTNKHSSYLSYTTMNNKHIFNDRNIPVWENATIPIPGTGRTQKIPNNGIFQTQVIPSSGIFLCQIIPNAVILLSQFFPIAGISLSRLFHNAEILLSQIYPNNWILMSLNFPNTGILLSQIIPNSGISLCMWLFMSFFCLPSGSHMSKFLVFMYNGRFFL